MRNFSIGTDIIEIERIEEILNRFGDHFLDKFFTDKEKEYCLSSSVITSQRVAGRFSAKEAIAKALGVGFGKKLKWLDIEILPSKEGKPLVFLHNEAAETFGHFSISISISHCKKYATASAIAIEDG